jgi:hypothetical protein
MVGGDAATAWWHPHIFERLVFESLYRRDGGVASVNLIGYDKGVAAWAAPFFCVEAQPTCRHFLERIAEGTHSTTSSRPYAAGLAA